MVKPKLTEKQRSILAFIEERITRKGHSPTIREIGQQFGISSTNGVRTHVTALIRKGFLTKAAHISRGLELTRDLVSGVAHVPLVGSVPAGVPIDAIENVEGEIALDLSFAPKGDSFSLNVVGDSMIGAGIRNGDVVVVRKQAVAQRGDIVVAIVDGEATVKRYFPEGARIRLQPENDDFEPIYVEKKSGDFRIAGKVVGLLRKSPDGVRRPVQRIRAWRPAGSLRIAPCDRIHKKDNCRGCSEPIRSSDWTPSGKTSSRLVPRRCLR